MKTQRTEYMERIMDAINLCVKWHGDQFDKCGQPYWIHPFTVAMTNFTDRDDPEQLSYVLVGLLHDVLEDTNVTLEELLSFIKLTDSEIEALKLLTRDNKTAYDEYIDHIIDSNNKIAMMVKMADLYHNSALNRFEEAGIQVTDKDVARCDKYNRAFGSLYSAMAGVM